MDRLSLVIPTSILLRIYTSVLPFQPKGTQGSSSHSAPSCHFLSTGTLQERPPQPKLSKVGNFQLHSRPHPDFLKVGLIETWFSSFPCLHSLGFSDGFGNATHETGPQEGAMTAACWQRTQDFSYPETQSLQGALRSLKVRGKPSKLPRTPGLRSSLLTPREGADLQHSRHWRSFKGAAAPPDAFVPSSQRCTGDAAAAKDKNLSCRPGPK